MDEKIRVFTRRLSDSGREFIDRRVQNREYAGVEDTVSRVFGYALYDDLLFEKSQGRRFNELIKKAPSSIEFFKAELPRRIAGKTKLLYEQLVVGAKERPQFVRTFLEIALCNLGNLISLDDLAKFIADEKLGDPIISQRGKPLEEALEYKACKVEECATILLNRLSAGNSDTQPAISAKGLQRIIATHVEMFLSTEQTETARLMNAVSEVKTKIEQAAKKGKIPVSWEILRERLDTVSIKLYDRMQVNFREIWGDFDAKSLSIGVVADLTKEDLERVVAHEMFHCLSSLMEVERTNVQDDEVSLTENEFINIGLRFSKNTNRLSWLNEAVTERETMHLLERQKGSYEPERNLLDILVNLGLPYELLQRAYYENYSPQQISSDPRPSQAIRELFTFTNHKFGQGFLMKLDAYIRATVGEDLLRKHPDSVVFLKNQGANLPVFIMNWYELEHQKN